MRILRDNQQTFWIGVDIGGTKILLVIADSNGRIVFKERVKTPNSLEDIIFFIKGCIARSGVHEDLIHGIGVGIPGIVDSTSGVVIDAPSLGWRGVNVTSEMGFALQLPLFINNDVNLAALGETWLGGATHVDDLLFIAIGTGIGSAIIINGKLIEGHTFSAGEIGYFIDKKDTQNHLANQPGSFGVLERYVSGTALSKSSTPAKQIFAEYNKGNQEAMAIVSPFILYLCTTIANSVSLLNPQKVVIGGGVAESLNEILDEINQRVYHLLGFPIQVEIATLGNNAGCMGAISYACQKLNERQNQST
jgi:glucokinase